MYLEQGWYVDIPVLSLSIIDFGEIQVFSMFSGLESGQQDNCLNVPDYLRSEAEESAPGV